MAAKTILFNHRARTQIANGLNALADLVRLTLGPLGRNVILDQPWGAPTITDDGVTVANALELDNGFANVGAQMVREVASKTAEIAGDGTSTATVLAQAIYVEGARLVAAGAEPVELKRGIDAAVETVVAALAEQSEPTTSREKLEQVATISANGDETIGRLVAEAMEKVGTSGVVTIEESPSMATSLELVEGMQFDRGYLSPYFVTSAQRPEVILKEAFILIYEKKISRMEELTPLVEKVARTGKSLLVVARDVDGDALTMLVVNKLRGSLQACAVRSPGHSESQREMLIDIATLSGGKAVTEGLGLELENMPLSALGRAKAITITRDRTTIVQGAGRRHEIQERVKQIRSQLEQTTSVSERAEVQERLAKIAGGVAVIKIGAATEPEMKTKKARVEDAVHATRAAAEEGVVPGGGIGLLRTLPALLRLDLEGDQSHGVDIIRRSLEAPLRQMAENAGVEGAVVVDKVCQGDGAYGYNVVSGEYEDLARAGVIDPTKVVRVALQNAASVASLMLTMDVLVGRRPRGAAGDGMDDGSHGL